MLPRTQLSTWTTTKRVLEQRAGDLGSSPSWSLSRLCILRHLTLTTLGLLPLRWNGTGDKVISNDPSRSKTVWVLRKRTPCLSLKSLSHLVFSTWNIADPQEMLYINVFLVIFCTLCDVSSRDWNGCKQEKEGSLRQIIIKTQMMHPLLKTVSVPSIYKSINVFYKIQRCVNEMPGGNNSSRDVLKL